MICKIIYETSDYNYTLDSLDDDELDGSHLTNVSIWILSLDIQVSTENILSRSVDFLFYVIFVDLKKKLMAKKNDL